MSKLKHLLLCITFVPIIAFGQNDFYSKQKVRDDLTYLQSKLIDQHPNIHIYTSKEEFSDFFENISIQDSLTEVEVYNLITTSNEVIKDGHTLFYPNKKWKKNNNLSGLFIPFQPFWDGARLFVSKNYSSSDELQIGVEIVSINGVKSSELIQGMLKKMMNDGNNLNYSTWVINTFFYEYFSYFYGSSNEYMIKLNIEGVEKDILVKGLTKIKLFENIKNNKTGIDKGINLEIDKERNIGILTIKDWHTDVLKKYYKQKFISEIKKVISNIESESIQDLIIDVRDNQGGRLKYSKYLLSYLLAEPFTLVEQYYKKKNGTIVECNGPQKGIHRPMLNNFKGNVYVLINGGSFSNTGIFSSVLRKHQRAIFIGEETGGSEFVLCGSQKKITLPNTGIEIELPRLQFMIKPNADNELNSVIPDYHIAPKIKYIIERKDKDLEFAFELINNTAQQRLKRQ